MAQMAAFNLGGRPGAQGFRTNSQNFVVGRKTASGAMVEKGQEICKGFLSGHRTYGNNGKYQHPEADSRAAPK